MTNAGASLSGSRRRELKKAGIAAAREARLVLADAIGVLDAEIGSSAVGRALAQPIAAAVASLYRAEIGTPEDVRDRLREAAIVLGRVLAAMHAPDATQALDSAGPLVARTLAILHPARAELDRELARGDVPSAPAPSLPEEREDASAREDERRSAKRTRIEAEVGAHTRSHFLTGHIGDLSTGGLFVATAEPLPIGTLLTIGLVLPNGYRVTVDATVTWVRGPHAGIEGMGVKFTRLSDADAQAIARHL